MAKLDENNYIKGTENSENFYQIEPGPQGSIKPALLPIILILSSMTLKKAR